MSAKNAKRKMAGNFNPSLVIKCIFRYLYLFVICACENYDEEVLQVAHK